MQDTVRELIIEAIKAKLGTISSVGLVVSAAQVVPGEDDAGIGECTAVQKKHAIELVVFDDVPNDALAGTDVEAWDFPVAAVIHLSDDLGGRTPEQVAADICGEVYVAYRGAAPADPTWGGKAVDTIPMGGNGGVAFGDLATRETCSLFKVKYRHTVGDPTAAR